MNSLEEISHALVVHSLVETSHLVVHNVLWKHLMLFVVNSLEDTLFRSPSLCGDISLCGTFSSGDISLFVVHSLVETSHPL